LVTVNPLPTATINGSATVCQNGTGPVITFTGANATPPYTFTYKLNNGTEQTIVSTESSATIASPTSTAGIFTYELTGVRDASSKLCSNAQSGTAVITINPLPVAGISYSGSPYCASGSALVTRTGQEGGSYVSSAGLVIDPLTGTVDLSASIAGNYTVNYNYTNGLCSSSSNTEIVINALPSAHISYGEIPYCATGTAAVTRTGQSGGTFSSTSGLIINAGTGVVDLAASTPGIYTVTYSIVNGNCSFTATADITINALPTAAISYEGTPYCVSGTALVTRTGQSGGVFSSAGGLSLDSATGDINLETSTAGTYTVTYTYSNGLCQNTANTIVTINTLPATSPIYHN
jgi:large repetitive protein